MKGKEPFKFAGMEYGELFAAVGGVMWMLRWCAINWDTLEKAKSICDLN